MPDGSNHTQNTALGRDAEPTRPSSTQTSSPLTSRAKPTFHFFAGALSGLSTSILLQPADLLKTRIQQTGSQNTSLTQTLRSIFSNNRPFQTLYRGTLPSALRTTLGSALYFTALSTFRRHQNLIPLFSPTSSTATTNATKNATPTATQNLLAGALSRTLAGLALMPVTVLKVRYESSLYEYPSLLSACRSIFREGGPRAFFAGFGATAVRDAPYAGLYVVFYEATKRRLNDAFVTSSSPDRASQDREPATYTTSAAINFTAAVLSASLATLLTNPFDAIKTRIQLRPQQYRNTVQAGVTMVRDEGMRSLLDGLGLRMARKAMSSALAWTVYEEIVKRGGERWV